MRRTSILSLVPTLALGMALLLTACSAVPPAPSPDREKGSAPETSPAPEAKALPISELEIGLGTGSAFEVAIPPRVVVEGSDPGERPLPGRAHPEAAPVIPHSLEDIDPITHDDNACVDCHQVEEKEEGEPTPMPPSHYTDLRNAPGTVTEEVEGARWVCVSCHVSRSDQAPLVGNDFGS